MRPTRLHRFRGSPGVRPGASPLLMLVLCLGVNAETGAVARLEDGVRQWLAVRHEIHAAQADWQREQALLDDEISLLQQNVEALARRATTVRRRHAEAEDRRDHAAAEKARREQVLLALARDLAAAERGLKEAESRLPDLVARQLPPARSVSPSTSAAERVVTRLERLLDRYAAVEEASQRVHVGRMMLVRPDGRETEVEVLFLGLSAGYAVTADGATAAVGTCGADGWLWHWDATLAAPLRTALAQYRKEAAAAYLLLPLPAPVEVSQ